MKPIMFLSVETESTHLPDEPKSWLIEAMKPAQAKAVSYTHLRAHETVLDLVCRLLLEKKKTHASNYITTVNPDKTHTF